MGSRDSSGSLSREPPERGSWACTLAAPGGCGPVPRIPPAHAEAAARPKRSACRGGAHPGPPSSPASAAPDQPRSLVCPPVGSGLGLGRCVCSDCQGSGPGVGVLAARPQGSVQEAVGVWGRRGESPWSELVPCVVCSWAHPPLPLDPQAPLCRGRGARVPQTPASQPHPQWGLWARSDEVVTGPREGVAPAQEGEGGAAGRAGAGFSGERVTPRSGAPTALGETAGEPPMGRKHPRGQVQGAGLHRALALGRVPARSLWPRPPWAEG